jgi:hypothetical protein
MSHDKGTGTPTIVVADTGGPPGPDRPEPSADTLLVGRYRIARRIGKGGMGEVMGARDEQVGREVAIKRMRAANPSERAIERFLREATVQGRLEHPAIVPVHEIGRDSEGLPFFVMKKLAGTSLSKILVDGDATAFPLQRVLRAFVEVCLAVEFAHVRGIIHRDLKADNIMLGDFGEVYVLDWGVAKVIGEDDGDFADVGSGSGQHATNAGAAIGTPGYMAPEQVRGAADIDGRADVYTLGCLLFEILAGEPLHPRGWQGLDSALSNVDARPSARTPGRDIPPELDELCVAATAPDRDARVRSARELGERLLKYLDGDRDLAKRRELAREHLARADAAFLADDGEAQRKAAMREAASALALDPALEGAAALVGRLMLEPPREVPEQVRVAMEADDLQAIHAVASAGLWAVATALVFMPFLWWIAPAGSLYVPALAATLLLSGAVAIHVRRAPRPRPGLIVLTNTVVVVVLARMYSPILIAPAIAASLGMGMVMAPRFSWVGSAPSIASLMAGAVLVPWLLERAGLMTLTVRVSTDGVLLSAPGLAGAETSTIIVGVAYVLGLVVLACAIGEEIRRRTRDAHRHLHLQAWQLRQLVPRSS